MTFLLLKKLDMVLKLRFLVQVTQLTLVQVTICYGTLFFGLVCK